MLFKKSYYLVPDETGAKAYALLRKALAEESKVGIAKVSFRDKEHLAALRFKDEVFVLETMYWPDEIRAAEFDTLDADGKVRANEVEMAKQLIESLTEPWNPEGFTDEYREALLEIVEKKLAGEPIEAPAGGARRAGRRPDGGAEGLGRGREVAHARREAGRASRPRRRRRGQEDDREEARAAARPAKRPPTRKKAVGE